MALDFIHNTKYAQPFIDRKMRMARNLTRQDDTEATISIADELSKLVKLKEQGAITEEEFLQFRSNLMKKTWIIIPKRNVFIVWVIFLS
jgi:hypothetical protein